MLLRKITKHVEDQNWLAVAVDLFIVVTGVFIGIQLGNWNDSRNTRLAFFEARDNLAAEHKANLEVVEKFIEDVEGRMVVARGAISALKDCATDKDAIEQVSLGVNGIRGTATLQLRHTALSAITGNDAFLSLVDKQERERLKEFERKLNQSQATLKWLEEWPFNNHVEDGPYLGYSNLTPLPNIDGVMIRHLTLEAPMDKICRDPSFTKPFYLWERAATFQSLRARQVRSWLSENIETKDN